MDKHTQKIANPTPSSGSRSALRVGLIGGAVLGLAAFASRTTASSEAALVGVLIVIIGMAIVGYYSVTYSGQFETKGAARTGAVGGLICGLMVGIITMSTLVIQSLNPAFRAEVMAQNAEMLRTSLPPADYARLSEAGVTMDTIYTTAVAFTTACCGALLPLSGLGLGSIGGAIAGQMNRGDGKHGA